MRLHAAWRSVGIAVLLTLRLGGAWPAQAQSSSPAAKPLFVGPHALGGQTAYRVVLSNQTASGTTSGRETLRITWKMPQLFVAALTESDAETSAVSEYVIPRGGDGGFALDRITPNDAGLQRLCLPLEALADVLDVASSGAGAQGSWKATLAFPATTSAPAAEATPAPAAASQIGCMTAPALRIPVVAALTLEADGSAVLVASGSVTRQAASPEAAATSPPPRRGGAGFGGAGFRGEGFPGGGSRGSRSSNARHGAASPSGASVSFTAHFARDGTLLQATLTEAVDSPTVPASAITHSVTIEKAA